MTHFIPTESQPTQYGQSRDERERTLECMRAHRASWWVYQRQCNFSAFNGYHFTPSEYSGCQCGICGRVWRTRAAYTGTLPDSPPQLGGSPG
jgi:hypothetical protein